MDGSWNDHASLPGNLQNRWQTLFARLIREWGLSIALIFFAILWLTLVAGTWAEAEERNLATRSDSRKDDQDDNNNSNNNGNSNSNNDEYSFNWLDPEKKIYVLQNRKFLKGGHPLLSVIGGVGFSNPYRSTYNLDPRLSYYFSEAWGIELFYTLTSNTQNSTFRALTVASGSSALPTVREIHAQFGGAIQYVPWYAKINVFNTILHFDWYFNFGAGDVQTFVDTRNSVSVAPALVQQDLLGLFFSTGHLYHLSQSFDFRIDVTGSFYQAPINGLTGDSSWYSNYNFGVGVGLKL